MSFRSEILYDRLLDSYNTHKIGFTVLAWLNLHIVFFDFMPKYYQVSESEQSVVFMDFIK